MIEEKTYFRPDDLKTALALLQRPDMHAVPLAGGSWLVPHLRTDVDLPGSLAAEVDAVVDLADLGLNTVRLEGSPGSGWLHLGATTLLADLVDGEACQAIAGGLLAEAARREGPVNLRNAATVAGSVLAAKSSSELLLALLALAADSDRGLRRRRASGPCRWPICWPIRRLCSVRGLITELRLPWPNDGVRGGLARVARTPADHPIVAAAAVVDGNNARVAIGGVTTAAGAGAPRQLATIWRRRSLRRCRGQDLVSDFRGSAEYRQAMAPIIAHRAARTSQPIGTSPVLTIQVYVALRFRIRSPWWRTKLSHPGTSGQNTGKISTRMTISSTVSGKPTFRKS